MWFRFVQLSSETFLTEETSQLQEKCIFERKRPRDNIGEYLPVDSIPRPVPKFMSKEIDPDALELSSEMAREEFYEGIPNENIFTFLLITTQSMMAGSLINQ